ncbi:MAG: hypothetical protein HY255_12640 [Betaproteobacteria bacterium]|nr:hypothetical protein [Betaproteobacteria bacterium]
MKKTLIALAITGISLTGCYVIPLDHAGRPGQVAYAPVPVPPPAPSHLNLIAKLYPANDQASSYGVLLGNVTNDLNGHGTFSVNIGGETLSGDATRSSPQSSQGQANAAGGRGSYLRCNYTMNNSSQGSGECYHSSGARFTLHLNG